MMNASLRRTVWLLVLLAAAPLSRVTADEAANNGADDYYADDQAQDDYAYEEEQEVEQEDQDNQYYENYNNNVYDGDDYIQCWTEYAIYPKRCVVM